MSRRIVGILLALILLPSGAAVLYAANAHPPSSQSCAVGFTGDRGTVQLNQDGTVDYTFKCTSAKYSEEVFFLLNIAGLTMTGAGVRGFLSAVRG